MNKAITWIAACIILVLATGCVNTPPSEATTQQGEQGAGKVKSIEKEKQPVIDRSSEDPSSENEADPSHSDNQGQQSDPDLSGGTQDNSENPASEAVNKQALLACLKELHELGQVYPEEGYIDYESGFRIFPLLHFILTKQSIPAQRDGEEVFMKDNPVFVTQHEDYAQALAFAPIHSKRTGVLQGVGGFQSNAVTTLYEKILFDQLLLATDIGPHNQSVKVNRDTWGNELAEYTKPCEDVLHLPVTQDEQPAFHTSGALLPFAEEIDFIAGQERVGYSLIQYGIEHRRDEDESGHIRIPVLLYCPGCEAESVEMVQDGATLTFQRGEYDDLWKEWLGEDWHAFSSEWIDFDEQLFIQAELDQISAHTPPFISENPTTIRVKMDGITVSFYNH